MDKKKGGPRAQGKKTSQTHPSAAVLPPPPRQLAHQRLELAQQIPARLVPRSLGGEAALVGEEAVEEEIRAQFSVEVFVAVVAGVGAVAAAVVHAEGESDEQVRGWGDGGR